jgi:hypothetical protein
VGGSVGVDAGVGVGVVGLWLGLSDEEPTPPQPVRTLKITSDAKQVARRFFLKWVIPGFSPKI